MELRELAEEVAARENDVPRAEVTTEEAKRLHLSLYHTHVPKLKDAGTIRHDEANDTVTLAVDPKRVERYEDLLDVE